MLETKRVALTRQMRQSNSYKPKAYLIDEMRQLGKEALHDWAVGKEVEKVTELIHDEGRIKNHVKKKLPGTPPSDR